MKRIDPEALEASFRSALDAVRQDGVTRVQDGLLKPNEGSQDDGQDIVKGDVSSLADDPVGDGVELREQTPRDMQPGIEIVANGLEVRHEGSSTDRTVQPDTARDLPLTVEDAGVGGAPGSPTPAPVCGLCYEPARLTVVTRAGARVLTCAHHLEATAHSLSFFGSVTVERLP